MRKLFSLCFIMYLVSSCTTPTEKTSEKTVSADSSKTNLVYTVKNPDNWDMGNTKNVAVAFNALKAFEEHKIDESLGFFGDSVLWKADYMDTKLDMHDFESVISKNKKDEYVTIWYVQTSTDKKGKIDSIAMINDMKIVNGKIVELDEYTRHFKVKK
jgi:hypothetical protein